MLTHSARARSEAIRQRLNEVERYGTLTPHEKLDDRGSARFLTSRYARGIRTPWDPVRAMHSMEQHKFHFNANRYGTDPSIAAVAQMRNDVRFQQMPVLELALSLFEDLDKIFFFETLTRFVYLDCGCAMRPEALGTTSPGDPIIIKVSELHFNNPDAMTKGKKRVDAVIRTLLHEMCHAYLLVGFIAEVDENYNPVRHGHGVYFGWLMGFCQGILEIIGWNIRLDTDSRYHVYSYHEPVWNPNRFSDRVMHLGRHLRQERRHRSRP